MVDFSGSNFYAGIFGKNLLCGGLLPDDRCCCGSLCELFYPTFRSSGLETAECGVNGIRLSTVYFLKLLKIGAVNRSSAEKLSST
jgi:hypothetical protein